MTLVSPTVPQPGDVAKSTDISTPINQIATIVNGNLDDTNISGLSGSKIANDTITTAKIANANVTPDKLATGAQTSFVATSETTTSTNYVGLTTVQAKTVTIGANGLALVCISHGGYNSAADSQTKMSVAVSGASTIAANDQWCTNTRTTTATGAVRLGTSHLFTSLTPGSTTFTAQFCVTAGTGTFYNREMIVIPL